jgi:hypothetical protein
MTVSDVLADALAVYRRLIRRSVVVAGIVFALIALADALAARAETRATAVVSLLLALVGGLLVQGALVEVVRDLHEGRATTRVSVYYNRTRGRLGTLLGVSLLYGLGVVGGFLLFVVPGLILLARWTLVVPLVVVEGLGVRQAFARSAMLVSGRTGRVLVLVVASSLITGLAATVITLAFGFLPTFPAAWLGGTVAGALAAPYQAHVLTVLYYKLTEPERPVLPGRPPDDRWRSVWDEEPPA